MGAETGIQWAHHSWSPWRGCTKVSPGCQACYAEALSKRNPKTLGVWGPNGTRVVGSASYWKQPLRWNREAREAGERRRVFPSLCDPFEDRPDLVEPRDRFFGLVAATPWLDWLVLTKRPEVAKRYFRRSNHWGAAAAYRDLVYGPEADIGDGLADWPPRNVWLGTSVENTDYLHRIDTLKTIRASILFLSLEPLLGPLPTLREHLDGIDWVIVGGESGPGARPCNIDWIRYIAGQCELAGTACYVKQLGAKPFSNEPPAPGLRSCVGYLGLKHPKGGDESEWPEDLRGIREFPTPRVPAAAS